MKVEKDYEDLLELFNKNKVRYCIIGAYAVAFYVKPRYTKYMDILVEATVDNAEKILKSLEKFGFRNAGLKKEDFIEKERIIQLGFESIRIDLITSIEGCSFKEVWENKTVGKYGEQEVYFIGLNELIKNKKKLDRKQDQADLEILLKFKESQKQPTKKG